MSNLNFNSLSVYVISLKDQEKRREFVKTQLDSLNIGFSFFDAINPSKDPSYFKFYDANLARKNYGRDLTRGELGCNLSHHFIYQELLEKKIPVALVLEDDALIEDDLRFFLDNFLISNNEWDVVLLGYSKINRLKYKRIDRHNPIGKIIYNIKKYKVGKVCKNYTVGTVAYLITQNGARKIIESNFIGGGLADDWNYYEKKANLNIYHCRPFLVYEDYENFVSAISIERDKISKKASKFFVIELFRYLRGFFRQIKMWLK